ncbi:MAG: iron-containing alcohol dehydrogenase [Acholeplasmatales bacterium]|nr:iron-containing alcohol dehydrogenase [Acholeplasmatales bacterium]
MISNFMYETPTTLVFGEGVIKELPNVLKKYGKNVLLTYGGGSIKKIGLYDEVYKLLKDFNIVELNGIEPNPKYDPSVINGAKLCKEYNIDVVLAVGGGSVLDCSKAIAACAKYDGEGWDLISGKVETKDALPLVDILTLAATGSEFDCGSVISYTAINDKRAYASPFIFPKVSFLDPRYTFSVSKWQTACGTADAMNHILESYFAKYDSILNNGMMMAGLKSLMHNVKIALEKPDDYDARAELMYTCTLACNGIFANGTGPSGWPMHSIEHALSAYFDITHGAGLAIITPRWMKEILSEKTLGKFVLLGKELFDIEVKNLKDAEKVIDAFYKFFESLGIPMHLKETGVDASKIDEMADHILEYDSTYGPHMYVNLDKAALVRILKESM